MAKDIRSQRERMLAGDLYLADDPQLLQELPDVAVDAFGLGLVASPPALAAERVGRGEARGLEQPRGEGGLVANRRRAPRQGDKHGLRHVFGERGVANHAEGGRINPVGVPPHQRAERVLRTVVGVLAQESHVVHSEWLASPISRRPTTRGDEIVTE